MDYSVILEGIGPQESQFPWDYYLYFMFFFQVILFVVLFNGTLRDVIMISTVILCAIADKLYLWGFIVEGCETINCAVTYHASDRSFLTFVSRMIMFVLPMVIITQTKVKYARPLSIWITILAAIYIVGRWFLQQRPERLPNTFIIPTYAAAAAPMGGILLWKGKQLFHAKVKISR